MRTSKSFMFNGIDVVVRVKKICKLKYWRNVFSSKGIPKVYVYNRASEGTTGLALDSEWRIVIGIGTDCDAAELEETILHELAHLSCDCEIVHGEKWRNVLRAAALEAWGVWSAKRIREELDLDLAAKIRDKMNCRKYNKASV